MRLISNRLGLVALATIVNFAPGCISKGNTYVGEKDDRVKEVPKKDQDAGAKPTPSDSEPDGADNPEPTTQPTTGPSGTPKPTPSEPAKPENTSPETTPTDNPEPTTTPTEPAAPDPTDTTSPSDTGTEPTPEVPAKDLVACKSGLKPGRGTPVQLTTASGTKRGLRTAVSPDGVLLAWQAVGANKVEAAYQAFDNDLKEVYTLKKIPEVTDVGAAGVAVAWDEDGEQWGLALHRINTARLSLIDGTGKASELVDTELPASASPLFLAARAGIFHVSALTGSAGCPGAAYFDSRLFDPLTSMSSTLNGPMCQVSELGAFDAGSSGFGVFTQPTPKMFSVAFLNPDNPMAQPSGVTMTDIDVSQGLAVGATFDSEHEVDKIVVAAQVTGGIKYGRFSPGDGMAVGSLPDVVATGTPRAIAVTDDAVGVALEDNANVRFFARDMKGLSFLSTGVVAAQKGLTEPTVITLDGQFTVVYLAEDEGGETQIFASKILCEPE
jgi:hypothetical protein